MSSDTLPNMIVAPLHRVVEESIWAHLIPLVILHLVGPFKMFFLFFLKYNLLEL
jgi:hypothetical protein